MRHDHPNGRSALLVALVVAMLCSIGCSSQQTPLANPFMAPDRVPPPTTRTLAPGTAQPYYSGDPLPTMQSAVTPTPAAPIAAAPAVAAPVMASFTVPAIHAEQTLAANEQVVAIPDDGQSLRFALPTPPPTQVIPAAPVVNVPASAPVQLAAAPYVPPTVQPVQPAVYVSTPTPVASGAGPTIDPTQLGPWRAPRVIAPPVVQSQPAPMPVAAVPMMPQGAVAVAPQPTMSVQLRPVSSPEPGLSPTPRIRMPSYASSFQPPSLPNEPAQAVAYATPPANGGTVQTVQITELPASVPNVTGGMAVEPVAAPTMATASQPTYIASAGGDGFRPRGSVQ